MRFCILLNGQNILSVISHRNKPLFHKTVIVMQSVLPALIDGLKESIEWLKDNEWILEKSVNGVYNIFWQTKYIWAERNVSSPLLQLRVVTMRGRLWEGRGRRVRASKPDLYHKRLFLICALLPTPTRFPSSFISNFPHVRFHLYLFHIPHTAYNSIVIY